MRRANTHPSQLTVDEEFYPKFQFSLNPKRNSVEFGSGEVFRFLHLPITPVSSAWPSDTRCCTCIFQQWVKTRIHQSRNACIMCRIGHRFDARGTRRKRTTKMDIARASVDSTTSQSRQQICRSVFRFSPPQARPPPELPPDAAVFICFNNAHVRSACHLFEI